MTPTRLNLEVLALTFKDAERVPNRLAPGDVPHLRRCLQAGLVLVQGPELVLTDAGRQAVEAQA